MTRAFNMFSPVAFNLDYNEGREFLFQSGYDLRIATYYSPDGDDLTDYPEIRSAYQRAMGVQNLERDLAKLARKRWIQDSLEQMYKDIRSGRRGDYEARDYPHNQEINKLFHNARKLAWIQVM